MSARVAQAGEYTAVLVDQLFVDCPPSHPRKPHWHRSDGDWNRLGEPHFRPLLVIDPEDAGAAESIVQAFLANGVWRVIPADVSNTHAHRREQVQAALRSLITPPRPDEPRGLGAVVEDADGKRFVFTGDTDEGGAWWWHKADPFRWSDIAAARVLSEGWSE